MAVPSLSRMNRFLARIDLESRRTVRYHIAQPLKMSDAGASGEAFPLRALGTRINNLIFN